MFKQSKSLEDFDTKLNTERNEINNLDLDGDGQVDYIMVQENVTDRSHVIQLQIAVSSSKTQDIAAILIDSDQDGEAKLQMIGDETVYGEEKIIEPFDEKFETQKSGPPIYSDAKAIICINVWA